MKKLNFPQIIKEEDYPLIVEDIKTLMNKASSSRRILYFFLSSTGMRIQETLKLRKRDLDFSHDRTMVKIKGAYTKTKKPRKTFITKEAYWNLESILKNKKDDDRITNMYKSITIEDDDDELLNKKVKSNLGESYYVYDKIDMDKLRKSEHDAIKEQDNYAKYKKTKKYIKKGQAAASVFFTFLTISKYVLAFL